MELWGTTKRRMNTRYPSVSKTLQDRVTTNSGPAFGSPCKSPRNPYKLDIHPFYTDASAAMSAGAEVKHALLGAGIESSHSYERTHLILVVATESAWSMLTLRATW